MVLLIENYIILASGEGGDNSEIDTETGGTDHDVFFSDIVGKALLEPFMYIEGSVKKWGAGHAGSIFSGSLDSGLFDLRVICQAHIAVGAEHEHFLAMHDDFGVLFA